MADCFERGDKPWGSVECGKCRDYLRNGQLTRRTPLCGVNFKGNMRNLMKFIL